MTAEAKKKLEAEGKVEEAHFFLSLLKQIEQQNQPITGYPPDREATFLASAFLNAAYSAIQLLKKELIRMARDNKDSKAGEKIASEVQDFLDRNPDLYSNGKKGVRHRAVHVEEVPAKPIEEGGSWGSGMWGETQWGADSVVTFYLEGLPNEPLVKRFESHIHELKHLIQQCKSIMSTYL